MKKDVTPREYCLKWIPTLYGKDPNAYGFRKACIAELAWLTGNTEKSVDNWGKDFEKAPKAIERVCEMADLLNEGGKRYAEFRKDSPVNP